VARTIVDIPDTQLRDLDALCDGLRISRAEGVRRAVQHFLRHAHEHGDDGFGLWRDAGLEAVQIRRALEEES
jgi:hypothetical protein